MPILALFSLIGIAAFIYTYLILAQVSQRLGAVIKMKPYYRLYYLCAALAAFAFVAALIGLRARVPLAAGIAFEANDAFSFWGLWIPLALSAWIALLVTWRYWSWLLRRWN